MKKPVTLFGLSFVVVAAVGVALIAHFKSSNTKDEAGAREKELAAGPHVRVVPATESGGETEITVQGEARPFATATIYAKVAGYLKDIKVDKGDKVQEGQVLAHIDSPETDRQYDSVVADEHNKLAERKRNEVLLPQGVVSQQDFDLSVANAEMASAQVKAVAQLKSYEILKAPFAGTVISRYADPGALVQNAANAQTGALPIVTIATLDKLRIYIYLEQRDAALARDGDPVKIAAPERPGDPLEAKLTRVSGELDPRTRMMLSEIDVDNKNGAIVPGGFVNVSIKLSGAKSVEVPSEALVFRGKDTLLAVVDATSHAHFKKITVASDDGIHARIVAGIAANDRVALNAADLLEGGVVQPVNAPGAR